jgi:ABC-2 type transport system ATP-binding protein
VAIGAYHLTKHFGAFQAVKDFNIEIQYGEVYGLLGANGAGKTTAIKMICGLLHPSSGEFSLLGRKTHLRSAEVRSQIGYMSQKFTLYDDLTIGENLDFYAGLYGLPQHTRKSRIEWSLEIAGLSGQQSMLTGQLPGGWKQRVAFGAAVMHEPKVIFLDEPTSGVDPLARRVMWRMINDLADHGAAVLVVTHYLEEAEQCNRIGFMAAGEMVAQGSPGEIKKSVPGRLLEVETSSAQQALRELRSRYGPSRVSLFGDRVHVAVDSEVTAEEVTRTPWKCAAQSSPISAWRMFLFR